MIHFFRLRLRALLYHLRMQQGFTNAQIRGALVLLILIFTLFSFSFMLRLHHETEEVLTKEDERLMDSLLCAVPVAKYKKQKSRYYAPSKKTYPTTKSPTYKQVSVKSVVHYNLNQIDSLQLIELRGIGPVLAGRILKFRKALGGFYTTEQLYEIWGLDSNTTKKILSNFYIKEEDIPVCININTADYYTLKDHPYITPPEASALMKYKKKRGKIISLSELEPLLAQYDKMKYYLCIE